MPNGTTGLLWVSQTQTSIPLLGGTLLAQLQGAPFRLPITLTGGATSISFTIPGGASGLTAYCQAAVRDATQSNGFAFTNGLQMDIF